jgi:Flp pilus assembly protein TadG
MKLQSKTRERGSAQIEFLFSVVIFTVMVFGAFELSMMLYTYVVMGAAAKAGVRYAIVHGTDSASCDGPSTGCDSGHIAVTTAVTNDAALSLHDISAITINVNYPDSSSAAPSRVQVQVAYKYIPYISIPGLSPTLVASAEGRIVY